MSETSFLSFYTVVTGLHVATGILGLGPLTALAVIVTRLAPTSRPPDYFAPLLRLTGWSLLGMMISGAGLIAFTHGALGKPGWMRVSFALFVVLGFLHSRARRKLNLWAQGPASPRSLGGILLSMCVLVALITYLMEAKPW